MGVGSVAVFSKRARTGEEVYMRRDVLSENSIYFYRHV
jgi:hypothetical protein